ncbi:MAG: FAD-binding protein [Rhodobacteraceae bacterium]|nr:FAD-binding protein [Paracoccaceae bacterium]
MVATEADLAEQIKTAQGPLRVQGGGTRGLSGVGEPLSVSGLSGVELYEPGALTLVVKAGTPVVQIREVLAAENQRLAFEPADLRGLLGTQGAPTIGAVFATNSSGPRRIQCGAARDHLLGVRFVDGQGQVIKNGGRVMKNVTGYDLVKLMAGAHGTLGVLTEVSLKVLPQTEAEASVLVSGVDLASAVQTMSAALGSPFDVTGAAYDPEAQVARVRVEGFADSVSYRAVQLQKLLAGFGEVAVEEETSADWADVRDVTAFAGRAGDVWRVSMKPTDAVAAAEQMQADALQFDWGGGLIWALVPEGTDLRARLSVPGGATLIRGSGETRERLGMFPPEPAPLAAISAGLRQKFDPRGILNPGLMG